ncbi:MAG TPA: hypothetical protein VKV69_11320 [Actinomycetota bacterium]|nr:hypothetical protein [Actinomycetota bacterium]
MKRVTRRRIVLVTAAAVFRQDPPFWIRDYFPGIEAWDQLHMQPLDDVLGELWPARVETLRVPQDCTDGCCGAYWRRPSAYLDPAVRIGISGFSQISTEEAESGLARLRADIDSGRWKERYGRLLDKDEFDVGLRMVIAER